MGRRSFLVALGVASTRGDQITRSMIAAYTFDDLTAADSGPNGWHGTAANYVPVVTERGDYAMSFGGNWDDDGGVVDDDIVFPAAVTAAKSVALSSFSNYFPVEPEDYGLPPCPESAINRTDTTGARLPRPDAETRARALPPLTRPPPSPADELSCTCDKGTTFCTRVESGHVTMLSPVEVAVVVICVLIVVLVAICMCAFAAKKKMIVKEVKHGPGNAL